MLTSRKPPAILAAAILLFSGSPVAAEGVVTVDNRSESGIKVVAEGGSATSDAQADPVEVAFAGGKEMGIDVKIWWVAKPRELCQLFVPWGRTVVVSGTSTIRFRSE